MRCASLTSSDVEVNNLVDEFGVHTLGLVIDKEELEQDSLSCAIPVSS